MIVKRVPKKLICSVNDHTLVFDKDGRCIHIMAEEEGEKVFMIYDVLFNDYV